MTKPVDALIAHLAVITNLSKGFQLLVDPHDLYRVTREEYFARTGQDPALLDRDFYESDHIYAISVAMPNGVTMSNTVSHNLEQALLSAREALEMAKYGRERIVNFTENGSTNE